MSRFNAYDREAELETDDIMGKEVNNFALRGNLDSVLEGISDIYNSNNEVVGGHNGNNHT